mgnify:CR=1 FL=1
MGSIDLWQHIGMDVYRCPACGMLSSTKSRRCPHCAQALTYHMTPAQTAAYEICMLRLKSGCRCDRCEYWTAPEGRSDKSDLRWQLCPLNFKPTPPSLVLEYINQRRTNYHVQRSRSDL